MARRGSSAPARSGPPPSRSGPPPAARQAPPPAAQHHAPPPPAPTPVHTPAPPTLHAPVQQQSGGMLAGLGASMAQGAAMGAGSAMGRMAVNSLFGGSSSSSAPAQAAPAAPAPTMESKVPAACRIDYEAFNDCLRANTGNASSCDFYYNALKSCQQSHI